MALSKQDKEIQQYRDLVQVPDKFEEGFGLKTIIGALFIGFVMVPGSIYLALFMGSGLGPAARWVTVILFAEVAKRSMKSLRKQEVFILFYMTGIALGGQLHGGIMTQLLWNQYLAQSNSLLGMGIDVPSWVAPAKEIIERDGRTFFTSSWSVPIFFILGMLLLSRIDHFGLGYALYRLTAHVEKLPFPMAPVGALGITALADVHDKGERWRWRWFSMGGAIGLFFGAIYIGIPAVTGSLFNSPIRIIPVPWVDLTSQVSSENFLPAMPINLVFDLGMVILGMVLPFWAVVGGFVGLLVTVIANPILYRNGMLPSWKPGMGLVDTLYYNNIDFYLSFGIGLSLAIFIVTIFGLFKQFIKARRANPADPDRAQSGALDVWSALKRHRERGDISVFLALGIYVFSTFAYIGVCKFLMPNFPVLFFLGFGFIYQPIISYVTAKLEGMVGQTLSMPYIREAAYILSGYRGSDIWFAPIPINDYGKATQEFRVLELTGTRLTSVIKTELVVIPIVVATSLLFSTLIWRMAPIPSPAYPYAQEYWELLARNFALNATATSDGSSEFIEAIKFNIIGVGAGLGTAAFAILSLLNMPTFLVFGIVRGLGQTTPGHIIPEMIGALIGRFILEKKLGHKKYKQYVSVLFAGFTAGMGLIGMAAIAFALIVKSTTTLGY